MTKRLAFLLALLGSLPAQAQYVTNPPGSGTFMGTGGTGATSAALGNIVTAVGNLDTARHTLGLGSADSPTWAGETLTGALTYGGVTLSNAVTGTGAMVLATSPTLVTPVIGAATGTSLSVTGQLTSTVSTGTAPFVVSSTTNVANLNASSLGGATFAAPGAIGGGTPAAGTFTSLTDNTMTSGSVLFAGTGGLVSQDNANFAYDSTHARLGVAVSGADLVDRLMVAADLTGGIITDSGNAQFMITGSTNKNKRLGFVYDTTGNFAAIQAAIAGVTVSPIAINPTGGNVGIGTTLPQALLSLAPSSTGFRNYNAFTDASNGEWYETVWAANVLTLGTNKNGTGSARALNIETGGTAAISVSAAQVVSLPVVGTGTPAASLCLDGSGNIIKKTTAGSCI